jgi:hypothetical protein
MRQSYAESFEIIHQSLVLYFGRNLTGRNLLEAFESPSQHVFGDIGIVVGRTKMGYPIYQNSI